AIDIYKCNFDHDIHKLDLANIDDYSIFKDYEPEIIIGGPPCQDFSSAGKRNEQERADLTIQFAKIVAEVKPKIVVMENVERIITTQALQQAQNILKTARYGCSTIVLNASEHYYRHPRSYARRGIFSIYEPSPTVRGVNRPIPPNYQFHDGDTCKELNKIRPLTTHERSLLQTFPADFVWGNKSKSATEQAIGNAVPVNLGEYLANAITNYLQKGGICKANQQINRQLSIFS
ncbi:MAG: (cytosine-5-)-methyltransferase, partial [Bacteroidota bacterium]